MKKTNNKSLTRALLVLVAWLICTGPAADADARSVLGKVTSAVKQHLTSSRRGYVPARPAKKGFWPLRKLQNRRVRNSQKLLHRLESGAWKHERQANPLLRTRGKYHNMVVRGKTSAGEEVSIIAGHHEKFPFVSNKGNWDNVQVRVGGKAYAIHDKSLKNFNIIFKGKGATKKVTLQYKGPMNQLAATPHDAATYANKKLPPPVIEKTVQADLRIRMSARSQGMIPMGVPGLTGLMGMEYFPHAVKSAPDSGRSRTRIKIDGRRYQVKVRGGLETGRITVPEAMKLLGRRASSVYDYTFVNSADGTSHAAFKARSAGSGKKDLLNRAVDRALSTVMDLVGSRKYAVSPKGKLIHDARLPSGSGTIRSHDQITFPTSPGMYLDRREVKVGSRTGLQEVFTSQQ